MTKKLMILLGLKLALVYSIIISFYIVLVELSIFILNNFLKISTVSNFSRLMMVSKPHIVVVIVGIIFYLCIREISSKEIKKISIDSKQSLIIFESFSFLFLGILLSINAFTFLVISANNLAYYLPNLKESLNSIRDIHASMIKEEIIRIIFSTIKFIVGIGIIILFKVNRKSNTSEI